MKNNHIKMYADILEESRAVIVPAGDGFIDIFESSEGGWYMTVYAPCSVWNDDLTATDDGYKEIDGGLCTGSAFDAVTFFL